MSMSHKAFAFEWHTFEGELLPLLELALAHGEAKLLQDFVDSNLTSCRDPYEGNLLTVNWQDSLAENNLQELCDYALTKYYDPAHDYGLGSEWIRIDDWLPAAIRMNLLGQPIGPPDNLFDPGKQGSYFQMPKDVEMSLGLLQPYAGEGLEEFLSLLKVAFHRGLGLYVTF